MNTVLNNFFVLQDFKYSAVCTIVCSHSAIKMIVLSRDSKVALLKTYFCICAFKKYLFILSYVLCPQACMSNMGTSLELELQMVVSCQVGLELNLDAL